MADDKKKKRKQALLDSIRGKFGSKTSALDKITNVGRKKNKPRARVKVKKKKESNA